MPLDVSAPPTLTIAEMPSGGGHRNCHRRVELAVGLESGPEHEPRRIELNGTVSDRDLACLISRDLENVRCDVDYSEQPVICTATVDRR